MVKNPNSRPDIQVLEDRVVRLKSQIEEFQGLRLYSVSKQRLGRVSKELEVCITMLDRIVGDTVIAPPAVTTITDDNLPEVLSEFSITDDSDLNDPLSIDQPEYKIHSHNYSSKYIVSTYSQRLQVCADNIGCASGIIQVNQFIQLLNAWYQTRFTPLAGNRNPNFYFKAAKISEWIDLMIVAAGNSLHHAMFPVFLSDMHAWISTLNTAKDNAWALPYSVMQIKQSDNCCTAEAIVLERILKPSLYDEAFYIDKLHSIQDSYINLTDSFDCNSPLDKLVADCSTLTVTSSFDSSKFEVTK